MSYDHSYKSKKTGEVYHSIAAEARGYDRPRAIHQTKSRSTLVRMALAELALAGNIVSGFYKTNHGISKEHRIRNVDWNELFDHIANIGRDIIQIAELAKQGKFVGNFISTKDL